MIKVASIQLEIGNIRKEAQINRAISLIYKASEADIILLPEVWNIGYFSFDLYREESEDLVGHTISRISAIASQIKSYIVAGSIIESDKDDLYNTAVFLDPKGRILTKYRKMHLFSFGSKEGAIITRGTEAVVAQTEIGNFGLSICYDLRFPGLYRKLLDQNTQIFLVVSAWPKSRIEDWKLLNRVRAMENQCFLISCNACGQNQGIELGGHSMIVDPWGEVLAEADEKETILTGDLDLKKVTEAREKFPVLKDRIFHLPPH